MDTLGGKTTTTVHKRVLDQLQEAFTVAPTFTVEVGQPVKLNDNGLIQPLAEDDNADLMIGTSLHKKEAGLEATVQMRGYAIIYASSDAALNAGPVAFAGTIAAADLAPAGVLNTYKTIAAGNAAMTGWSLDKATAASQEIRVVMRY